MKYAPNNAKSKKIFPLSHFTAAYNQKSAKRKTTVERIFSRTIFYVQFKIESLIFGGNIMKDLHEQDLFGEEKPQRKNKKNEIERPLESELDFSTEPAPESKIAGDKKEEITEQKETVQQKPKQPILLSQHLKKNTESHDKAKDNTSESELNRPKSQKTLHELKRLAKEAGREKTEHKEEKKETIKDSEIKVPEEEKKDDSLKQAQGEIKTPEKAKPTVILSSPKKTESDTNKTTVTPQKTAPPAATEHKTPQPKMPVSHLVQPKPAQAIKHIDIPEGGSVGHILQEARVKIGYSIDQVAIETRIKKSYIEALERDDLNSLPTTAYVNAYVRKLCQIYGLDESLAKKIGKNIKTKSNSPQVPLEVLSEIEKGKQVNEEKEKRLKTFQIALSSAIAIIIAISAFFIILAYTGKKTEAQKTAEPVQKTAAEPKMSDEQINAAIRELILRYPGGQLSELKMPER